jgi:NADH dehydrogenase
MAGPAVQMGTWVARDILERSRGREHRPFRYVDFGTMAVIGPLFAVADLRGWKVSGAFGFLLWALAHLAFMPARENRLILLTKWLWMILVRQRSALVISEPVAVAEAPAAAAVSPGS